MYIDTSNTEHFPWAKGDKAYITSITSTTPFKIRLIGPMINGTIEYYDQVDEQAREMTLESIHFKSIQPRGKKTKARYQAWLDEQERAKQPKFQEGEYARFNQDYGASFKKDQVVKVTGCDEKRAYFKYLDNKHPGSAFVERLDKHEYRAGDWVEFINNGHHIGRKGQKVQVKSIDAEGDLWITGISRTEKCTHSRRVKPCAEPEPVDIWEGAEYAITECRRILRSTQYLTQQYGDTWKNEEWSPIKLTDCTNKELLDLIKFDLSRR